MKSLHLMKILFGVLIKLLQFEQIAEKWQSHVERTSLRNNRIGSFETHRYARRRSIDQILSRIAAPYVE
jgi:hypothetical protein